MGEHLTVLHVVNRLAHSGGAEVSLLQLLPGLQAAGLVNVVLPLHPYVRSPRQDEVARSGVLFLPEPTAFTWPSAARRVAAAARAYRPDVVHGVLWEASLLARTAGRVTGAKVLVSHVNTQYDERAMRAAPSPRRLQMVRRLDGLLSRRLTDGHHAITEAVADRLPVDLGVRRDAVRVVPRGRDRALLGEPGPERRRRVRAELGIPEGAALLVNVARQEPQKGQQHLLAAADRVARRLDRELHLVVAGREGGATATLAAARAAALHPDRVHLLGRREDVGDLLTAADVFVFSSLWEGFGGALAEALAMALPIVAFDIAAVREVTAGAALLVPAGDEEGLADSVERVLRDPALAEDLGRRARAVFEERYELSAVTAQMVSMYQDLAR